MDVDQFYRIVEIEDQPEVVYAQLVAEGLHPGMEIRLIENSHQRVRFWAGDNEHVLAPIMATNIEVVLLEERTRRGQTSGGTFDHTSSPVRMPRYWSFPHACGGLTAGV